MPDYSKEYKLYSKKKKSDECLGNIIEDIDHFIKISPYYIPSTEVTFEVKFAAA